MVASTRGAKFARYTATGTQTPDLTLVCSLLYHLTYHLVHV
jgi:hypothetical protein